MADHRIRDNEDIYTMATVLYGSPEYAIQLLQDNPLLYSGATSVVYDPAVKKEKETISINVNKPAEKDVVYSTFDGQSFFDLAIQLHGNIEASIQVAREKGKNLNQNPIRLAYTETKEFETEEAQKLNVFMKKKGVNINTSNPKIKTGSGFSSGFLKVSFF